MLPMFRLTTKYQPYTGIIFLIEFYCTCYIELRVVGALSEHVYMYIIDVVPFTSVSMCRYLDLPPSCRL